MKLLLIFSVLMLPIFGLAQEVIQPVVDLAQPLQIQDFLQLLISSMGGVKGASSLAIVGVVIQCLMGFIRLSFSDKFFGKINKMVVIYGLSVVGGVIALMSQGISLQAALIHANSLAAYQVFLHQAIKQYADKKNDVAPV